MALKLKYFLAFLICTLFALAVMQLLLLCNIGRGIFIDPLINIVATWLAVYRLRHIAAREKAIVTFSTKVLLLITGVSMAVALGFICWGIIFEIDFFASFSAQVYRHQPDLTFGLLVNIVFAFLGLLGGEFMYSKKQARDRQVKI